jgi:cell fate (sporulation/competence/biofilm development) regulator YlbF (YheA/YmcA/DUF963 family)
MEKIMEQAAELGRCIRKTEVYSNFIQMSEALAGDAEASKLLDDYANSSAALKDRQDKGDIIEQFEFDQLNGLADMVSGNDVIMNYLSAREKYLGLLSGIQEKLGEVS